VPVVYSLYNPRGLTSLRIRLSYQSILFQLYPYSPLSISPLYLIFPTLFRRAASFKILDYLFISFIYIYYPPLKSRDDLNRNSTDTL